MSGSPGFSREGQGEAEAEAEGGPRKGVEEEREGRWPRRRTWAGTKEGVFPGDRAAGSRKAPQHLGHPPLEEMALGRGSGPTRLRAR